MALTREEIDQIAARTAEEVVERMRERELSADSLVLHSLAHMCGSPGIVWNEEDARKSHCLCTDDICHSRGIIGSLSPEQREWACNPRIDVERPALKRRIERWRDAVEECKVRLEREAPTDGIKRVETWLKCMSSALKARGVEA